ncbi:multiprotein bridging factor aMBF1 [Caldiplasma sukawensis]
MCGQNVPKTRKVRIDGAILSVCPKCEKFGTPIEEYRTSYESEQVPIPQKKVSAVNNATQVKSNLKNKHKSSEKLDIESLEIVPDYNIIIRETREKMGISQEELADKLKEKRTLIYSIERGKIKPDIKLAKKLETFLKVKIIEKV